MRFGVLEQWGQEDLSEESKPLLEWWLLLFEVLESSSDRLEDKTA
jgi:hypothetical protein